MAKAFISYSRKDIEFAKQLTGGLQKSGLDFWIDWEGIPPTVDWWKEIEKGIEEADAFLFLISPDSASSKVCRAEIEHAVKNGKRLIPLVIRDTLAKEIPPQLSSLNWIFFRETDDFDASIANLLKTIHTDYEWIQTHRRLQVKALEWERNQRENSFLLHGKDLLNAEIQLATNTSKEPYPTELQREYILTSRSTADMQHRSSRLRRNLVSTIGVVLIITIVLATTGKLNRFIYRPADMEDYWVTIPAGEFIMGSDPKTVQSLCEEYPPCDMAYFKNESPAHVVSLKTFEIGRYEITNRQYIQCEKAGICSAPANKTYNDQKYELHPVTDVNWDDANKFCKWLGGRLPTEAEWEKSARGTDGRIYPWGNNGLTANLLNYNGNIGGTTTIGNFPNGKSSYGLFDMAGNVSEWVNDWYSDTYYQSSPLSNPLGPDSGQYRVIRGGSWLDFGGVQLSAYRNEYIPTLTIDITGFRCARDVP